VGREGGADGGQIAFGQLGKHLAVLVEIPGGIEDKAVGTQVHLTHQAIELGDIGDNAFDGRSVSRLALIVDQRAGINVATQEMIRGPTGGSLQEMAGTAAKVDDDRAEARQWQAQSPTPFQWSQELSFALVPRVRSRFEEGLKDGGIDIIALHDHMV
jgi:hypothetical protein